MNLDLPFRGSVAVTSGAVTADRLRGPGVRRLAPDVYLGADTPLTLRRFLEALALWRPDAVVAGPAAAAVWCDADTTVATRYEAPAGDVVVHHGVGGTTIGAVDLVVPGRNRPPSGVRIRCDALGVDEVAVHDGLRVTSPARTVFDVVRRLSRDDAVVTGDAVARRRKVTVDDVTALIDGHGWERGLAAARRTTPWLEPRCRTPLVSRVRLTLLDHGIVPTQVGGFVTEGGVAVGSPDLSWPELRCAVLCGEREVGQGAEAMARELVAAGWSVRRVPDEWMVRPSTVADTVRYQLRAARHRQRVLGGR